MKQFCLNETEVRILLPLALQGMEKTEKRIESALDTLHNPFLNEVGEAYVERLIRMGRDELCTVIFLKHQMDQAGIHCSLRVPTLSQFTAKVEKMKEEVKKKYVSQCDEIEICPLCKEQIHPLQENYVVVRDGQGKDWNAHPKCTVGLEWLQDS